MVVCVGWGGEWGGDVGGWGWYDRWMMRYSLIFLCVVCGPVLTLFGDATALATGEGDAPGVILVGDGGDLWELRVRVGAEVGEGSKPQVAGTGSLWGVEVLHHAVGVPGSGGTGSSASGFGPARAGKFVGRLAAGGVTADSGKLWVVYEGGPGEAMVVQRIGPAPAGADMRSFVLDGFPTRYEVALGGSDFELKVKSEKLKVGEGEEGDKPHPPTAAADDALLMKGIAGRAEALNSAGVNVGVGWGMRGLVVDDEVVWALVADRFKTDHLLELTNQGWEARNLPEDWVHGQEARLVKSGRGLPWLLRGGDVGGLVVYRGRGVELKVKSEKLKVGEGEEGAKSHPVTAAGEGTAMGTEELNRAGENVGGKVGGVGGWGAQVVEGGAIGLGSGEGDGVSAWDAVSVSGQLVLGAMGVDEDGKWTTRLGLVRESGVIALGELAVEGGKGQPTLLGLLHYVAVGQKTDAGELALVGCDLLGKPMPRVLSEEGDWLSRWLAMSDMVLMVSVFAGSMLLMFVFWQRDPSRAGAGLPEGVVIGELSQRMLAGLIDFGPGVVLAMGLFGMGPREMMYHWPGQSGGLAAMLPSGVAIGVFVVHTLIDEMLTQRTMGKRVMGLRVVGLDGERAGMGRILVRNLLKSFDLIAVPLLLMPIVTPMRQRLGDLVAKTVVVQVADEKKKAKGEDE